MITHYVETLELKFIALSLKGLFPSHIPEDGVHGAAI